MQFERKFLKHLLLILPFLAFIGLSTIDAQEDSDLIRVTEKGTEYQMTGWDARVVYNPYSYSYYIIEQPEMKVVNTRKDYFVKIGALDRPPVFSFDGTCLLKKEGQLECSNDELFDYVVYKDVDYPEEAQKELEEGIVYISFMLNKEGDIENIKVLDKGDKCPNCVAVAVDLIKESESKWYPAILEGKEIATHLTVPVRFELKSTR